MEIRQEYLKQSFALIMALQIYYSNAIINYFDLAI